MPYHLSRDDGEDPPPPIFKAGDLVWLNADIQMGGDLREKDGAEKRVKELLRGFPKRDAPPAPAIEDKTK